MHTISKRKLVDHELTLREMLDDPIVQDVMRRDGVQRWQIENLFETLRPSHEEGCMMSRVLNVLRLFFARKTVIAPDGRSSLAWQSQSSLTVMSFFMQS